VHGDADRTGADNGPDPRAVRRQFAIGIAGAGRSRNGLGPFLAAAFVAAGHRLAGVAGRDLGSAERAAAGLAGLAGPVRAFASVHELARGCDALVVASPVPAHREGLEAALAAGIPCLCEKPLVDVADAGLGLALVAAFRARGLLLAENCQWPFVLPALYALHPSRCFAAVRHVAMGLGPSGTGRAMLEDCLPHVLSVVQALAGVDPEGRVRDVRQTDASPRAVANVLGFTIAAHPAPVAVELHLRHCPAQPRPAWLAVDGARIDRAIGPGYALSFTAGGIAVPTPDPLRELVYRFAALLSDPAPALVHAHADSIATRIRSQASVFAALDR